MRKYLILTLFLIAAISIASFFYFKNSIQSSSLISGLQNTFPFWQPPSEHLKKTCSTRFLKLEINQLVMTYNLNFQICKENLSEYQLDYQRATMDSEMLLHFNIDLLIRVAEGPVIFSLNTMTRWTLLKLFTVVLNGKRVVRLKWWRSCSGDAS